MAQDKEKEIRRGSQIRDEAEFLWGWGTPAGKLRAERRARVIIDKVKEKAFTKILEVGCGTGMFTKFFCEAGLTVTGIDIAPELLKKARSQCPQDAKLVLEVADIEHMPYEDGSFDAVVGVCVLHHLNVMPSLKEVYRVVKRDGIIVFSEPNMMNPQLMVQKNVKPIKRIHILGETEDETAFFKWQIRRFLKEAGFKDASVTPFDFLHPWTPKPFVPFVKRIGFCLEKIPLVKEIAGSLLIYAVK